MEEIKNILEQFQTGGLSLNDAEKILTQTINNAQYRIDDIREAKVDIDRERRTGFPEIVFGEGKTAEQIVHIMTRLYQHTGKAIATRVDEAKARSIRSELHEVKYHASARMLTWFSEPITPVNDGYISVLSAGTSDQPVADEAALIAECFGNTVERIYDIGVSGIHRVFSQLDLIRDSNVIIVAAGMEGALASVIGGLVSKPVIAVPTSQGYGANFQGLAPLLSMLNACAPGVAVMNIDNGFGAGYYASLINSQLTSAREP